MYAVFFMSETLELPGVEDQHVYLFDTQDEADGWIVNRLIDGGYLECGANGTWRIADKFIEQPHCVLYDTAADAVSAMRSMLFDAEFLHVYPVGRRSPGWLCRCVQGEMVRVNYGDEPCATCGGTREEWEAFKAAHQAKAAP